jgi:DNA-binding MarR family transcriptional regulator
MPACVLNLELLYNIAIAKNQAARERRHNAMIDPLANYPGYLLRRVSAGAMASLAKRLKKLDLSPTEATILNVIDANPSANQSDIGRLLDIARANMAPLVARLADRGLIERQPVDKRSHGLVLTRAGRTLTATTKEVFAEHETALLAKVPKAHRAAFFAAMRALLDRDRAS